MSTQVIYVVASVCLTLATGAQSQWSLGSALALSAAFVLLLGLGKWMPERKRSAACDVSKGDNFIG